MFVLVRAPEAVAPLTHAVCRFVPGEEGDASMANRDEVLNDALFRDDVVRLSELTSSTLTQAICGWSR
jgi:hypothetical protein